MSSYPSTDVLKGGWAKAVYYTLGCLHDFAYFGYITVQPLIFHRVISRLPQFQKYSFEITIFVISTHLLWQVFLETPTGAYADSRGRMRAVRDHFIIRVACMFLLLLAIFLSFGQQGTFIPWLVLGCLFLIEFGMAAAEALLSGSFDAWIVDTLDASGLKGEAAKVFATAATLFNTAILLAMPMFLFVLSLKDPTNTEVPGTSYFVTCIAAVVFAVGAMVAHASRREVYRMGAAWAERSKATWKTTWHDGRKYLWQDHVVWWTTMLKAAPFAAWVVISWVWPLLVKGAQASGEEPKSGLAFVVLAVLLPTSRILGSALSYLVQKFTGSLSGLLAATGFNLLMVFSTGLTLCWVGQDELSAAVRSVLRSETPVYVLPALFFGGAIALAKGSEEIVKILNQLFLAKYIEDDTVRATVSSFTTAAANLVGFVLINVGLLIVTFTQEPRFKAPYLLLFVAGGGVVLAIVAGMAVRGMIRTPARTAPVVAVGD